MTEKRIRGLNTERRDRPDFHASRTNKGHPRREARRQRAAERIAVALRMDARLELLP